MHDLLALSSSELSRVARELGVRAAGRAREIHRQVVLHGRFDPEELGFSEKAVADWRQRFSLRFLDVVRVVEEPCELGITAKAVLRLDDGIEAEVVFIPMGRGRSTLCISSQVGCKMGCTFCETAKMGLVRSLTSREIVGQLMTARHVLGWGYKNIVFMGMGDALDNAEAVFESIAFCNDSAGLQWPQERFTVCTVGHRAGLEKFFAQQYKRVNLSISLNSPDDTTRSKVMPVNRKLPLAELGSLLAGYAPRPNFVLGVNYCLLPGLNATRDDARGVAEFCRGIPRVLVNVIPYNPGSAPITRAPTEDEVVAFIDWLRDEGLPVRRRITKGRSVMAACGQLGNLELRRSSRSLPLAPASERS